jgi:adenylyltransferase/sulfurtransferase
MENLLGDVTVYYPDVGPCYECNLTQIDKAIIAQVVSCRGIVLQNLARGKVPTTSTMGSIISALQVQEAIKILHAPEQLSPQRLVVNCESNDFYSTSAIRREECEGHFRYGDITEVPEWSSAKTTAKDILDRFEADMDDKGHLRLGREIVIAIHCPKCNITKELGEPLRLLTIENAICPSCGELREPKTTNVVRGGEPYSDWSLEKLGVPLLEILETRGIKGTKWYEITGDIESFF